MKNSIISILIGAVLAYGGYTLINMSSNMISQEEFSKAENLCNDSEQAAAMVANEYLESTTEIGSSEIVTYELTYNYEVNGTSYAAKKTIDNLETQLQPVLTIWYNKADPSINTTDDPCETLTYYNENKRVGTENYYLIPGAIIGLLGISIVWGTIKAMIASLFTGGKKD